jgi:hypothetical protein
MKKTFLLQQPGKADARVRDKIRHEVNKSLKRGRARPPAEGFRGWDFTARVGVSEETAESVPLKAVAARIDEVAATGSAKVFIELTAVPARRVPVPTATTE